MTFPKKLTTMRCPCGDMICKKWIISPLFISADCGLDKEEAEEVCRRWNAEAVTIAPRQVELLEWAVDQAEAWKATLPGYEELIVKAREAVEQVKLLQGDPVLVGDAALLRVLLDRAMRRPATKENGK